MTTIKREGEYFAFAVWETGMSSLYEGDKAQELYDRRETSDTTYAGRTHVFLSRTKAMKAYIHCAELLDLDWYKVVAVNSTTTYYFINLNYMNDIIIGCNNILILILKAVSLNVGAILVIVLIYNFIKEWKNGMHR